MLAERKQNRPMGLKPILEARNLRCNSGLLTWWRGVPSVLGMTLPLVNPPDLGYYGTATKLFIRAEV
jgi:hypothetical protein